MDAVQEAISYPNGHVSLISAEIYYSNQLSTRSLTIHQEVTEAYDKVRQPSSRTDWILLGPAQDGGLKLQSEGAGGLDEIEEEFHDGRIQFAFIRVVDPNVRLAHITTSSAHNTADATSETSAG